MGQNLKIRILRVGGRTPPPPLCILWYNIFWRCYFLSILTTPHPIIIAPGILVGNFRGLILIYIFFIQEDQLYMAVCFCYLKLVLCTHVSYTYKNALRQNNLITFNILSILKILLFCLYLVQILTEYREQGFLLKSYIHILRPTIHQLNTVKGNN